MSDCIVGFNDLEEGDNHFSYEFGHDFFASLEQEELQGGEVTVNVVFTSSSGRYRVSYVIEGAVQVICDRCLAVLTLPVETQSSYNIVFRDDDTDADDLIVLPSDSLDIDLSWHLYESILLSLPAIRMHEEGECDLHMQQILDSYLIKGSNENEV